MKVGSKVRSRPLWIFKQSQSSIWVNSVIIVLLVAIVIMTTAEVVNLLTILKLLPGFKPLVAIKLLVVAHLKVVGLRVFSPWGLLQLQKTLPLLAPPIRCHAPATVLIKYSKYLFIVWLNKSHFRS